MSIPLTILTNSSTKAFRTCPTQFYYRYVLGLMRNREATPLRVGGNFHRGLELMNNGEVPEWAIAEVARQYDHRPEYVDPFDWEVERVTVATLLEHHRRWHEANGLVFEFVATEMKFEIDLVNPETGSKSRTFKLAGKIDGIVRLADGRLAIIEYKTAGEDISDASDYWLRLRIDPQISIYFLAARELGYDVDTVIYDVTRKPGIAPRQIPRVDADGFKVVYDREGCRVFKSDGKPRQTADEEKGYTLQTDIETPQQFRERLDADIASRPEFYFACREIPRLQDDLDRTSLELWQQGQAILASGKRKLWFRNPGRNTCSYCSFSDICLQSINVDGDNPPVGFTRVDNPHVELEGVEA